MHLCSVHRVLKTEFLQQTADTPPKYGEIGLEIWDLRTYVAAAARAANQNA